MQGLGSIRYQGDLVKKVYFPRQILPFVYMIVNCVNMLISFAIIYSILLISGWGIDLKLQVWLLFAIVVEFFFAFGMALMLSAVEVYFRDVEHIFSVLLMVWMYVTPMFYSLSIVPERFVPLFKCNPMLYIIGIYQQVLYYKIAPSPEYLLKAALFAFGFMILGWIVFDKLEKRFAEEL